MGTREPRAGAEDSVLPGVAQGGQRLKERPEGERHWSQGARESHNLLPGLIAMAGEGLGRKGAASDPCYKKTSQA